MGHDTKKPAGQFKKAKGPSEYKLAMGQGGNPPVNPADKIGLNPRQKKR